MNLLDILSILGTAVSAVGSLYQGRQQQQYYEAQASRTRQQSEMQAAELERQRLYSLRDAAEERAAAAERSSKIRRAAAREVGRARASLAASGVSADVGSAVTIQDYISAAGESDAMAELVTGQRRSRSLTERADAYGRQAAYTRAGAAQEAAYLDDAASNAMRGGMVRAGSTLLSGWLASERSKAKPVAKSGWIAADRDWRFA